MYNKQQTEYIFMDIEFDFDRGYTEILSIGAVKCNRDFDTIDKFYTLAKPLTSRSISEYVKRLTGLNESVINTVGKELPLVFEEFSNWLGSLDKNKIFVWGDEDKRVLEQSFKTLNVESKYKTISDSVINIQSNLCEDIFNSQQIASLSKMKYIYNIEGKVKHHALEDAIDLMNVYKKYKTSTVDSERLSSIQISSKEFHGNYQIKLEEMFEYIVDNHQGKLELNALNTDFQIFLHEKYLEYTTKTSDLIETNKVILNLVDDTVNIYYKYNNKCYNLKINRNDISGKRDFYKRLNKAVEVHFVEADESTTFTSQSLNEREIDILEKHNVFSHVKIENILSKSDPSTYLMRLDKVNNSIDILNNQKKRIMSFNHDFKVISDDFKDLINHILLPKHSNSKQIKMNNEIIKLLTEAIEGKHIYLNRDKSETVSIDSFNSDIEDLSKEAVSLSLYAKLKFKIKDNKLEITKTKGEKQQIKLYLNEKNLESLIEYLINLAKTKRNKFLTISESDLKTKGVSLNCNNQEFAHIINKILRDNKNEENFNYKIRGEEIIIQSKFNHKSIGDINITRCKHAKKIPYITLHTQFSSRKYFMDKSAYKIFDDYCKDIIFQEWINKDKKIEVLTKSARNIINTMYSNNLLKLNFNSNKNDSFKLLSYKFNNKLYLLFKNNRTKLVKKVKIHDESDIHEFINTFPNIKLNKFI